MRDPGLFVLPFGQYKDQTLEEVASTDSGLLYLDRIIAEDWIWASTRVVIEAFLGEAAIQSELARLLEDDS